jgi:hypothetical protein
MSRVRRSKGVSDRPKGAARTAAGPKGLTEEEKAAMKELVQERRGGGTGGEEAVLAKIAEMNEEDRAIARRIHEIITANAPALSPRTWYGMPAYSDSAGDVVCFFQPAQSSRRDTPRSGSATRRSSTTGTCGRPRSQSRR